jgi:hypothetical protein
MITTTTQPRAKTLVAFAFALTLTGLGGCDDDDGPPPSPARNDGAADTLPPADVASSDTADASAPDGASGDVGDAAGDAGTDTAPAATSGVIILSSDRTSSSISLAAPDGTGIIKDHCLHSGSVSPLLSAALSGDVVLPTSAQPSHEIVLLDRKNGTVTWAAPDTCAVLRQVNAGASASGTFSSNPYDLIGVGDKGYVTRYNTNPGNAAEGSDVLVIDTKTGAALGRIDLRASASPSTPPAMPLLPGPTRGVLLDDKVYIALNNLSADYSTAGVGRLAVIDPVTDTVAGTIDLPGLKNCGVVDLTAADATGKRGIVVGCSGSFSDGPAQIDASGIAWVDVSVTPATVTVVKAAPFARPVSGFDAVALSPAFGATVVPGEFGMPPNDAVFAFDFTGGAPRKIYDADASFSLATGLDHQHALLYVLDASKTMPRVLVYAAPVAAGAAPAHTFVANPRGGLPPRQLGFY